jgi:hypothetical protein
MTKLTREDNLQRAQVQWFALQYPEFDKLLFAIPNGGLRHKAVAAKMKMTGVVAGVADLFLAVPNHEYHGLFIENKIKPNRQTDSQKDFEKQVKAQGYAYEVCYDLDGFMRIVESYLFD